MTEAEYNALKSKHAAFEQWRNGRTSYPSDSVPADVAITNEERSAIEVFEFMRDKPERYFLYINEARGIATTWTGAKLGVVWLGRRYRDNFGGERVSISIRAINGESYSGTFYKSSGDYARVRTLTHVKARR